MHPLLQLLLLSFIPAFAGGQQSFYSINGQHPQAPGSQYGSPNLGVQSSYVGSSYQQQQQPSSYASAPVSNNGYNSPQVLSYGAAQAAAPTPAYQTYNPAQPTSQSQQTYAYAPAPQQQQQQASTGYGAQAYSNVQPAVAVNSYPQQQQQQQQPQYTSYSSPAAVQYTPIHHHQQQQQQQQAQLSLSQPQQQAYAAVPTAMTQPQGQFSQRQLPFSNQAPLHGVPYGVAPGQVVNPPPTTSTTHNSFSQTSSSASGPGLNPQQLLSRRGPLDGIMSRAKEWMPSLKKTRNKLTYSAGVNDMSRLPKPPKYPLYDMAGMGMATPPPPPLMSPMSQMPSGLYSSFNSPIASGSNPVPQRGGRPSQPPPSSSHPPRRGKGSNNKRRRNRPHPPPPPPPAAPKFRENKRQRPRSRNPPPPKGRNTYTSKVPMGEGFDHPMASNVAPVNSPPLGRPLGFDEYMKRPTHSFTDDPWNFDPNAQNYNEGMNTHAMKYNYDPLGTNALDTSVQSHLDINKMSYPGDSMHMDSSMKDPAKPLTSQLGGWDLPPQVYRSGQPHSDSGSGSNNNNNNNNNNNHGNNNGGSSNFNRYEDQLSGGSSITFDEMQPSTTRSSFSPYDATEASIVKSETLSPITLISGSDGAIEFDIDSTLKGGSGDNYNDNYKSSNNNNNNYNDNYKSSNNNNNYNDNYKSSNNNNNYNDNYKSSNRDNYNNNYNNNNNYKSSSNNNNDNYSNYKLSDHYSPIGESQYATPQQSNYDQYSSSNYNSYSRGNEYGSRHTRANGPHPHSYHHRSQQQQQPQHAVHQNAPPPPHPNNNVSKVSSSSSSITEGMGLFHDFIKDPNPGVGKARARHSLYKALMS